LSPFACIAAQRQDTALMILGKGAEFKHGQNMRAQPSLVIFAPVNFQTLVTFPWVNKRHGRSESAVWYPSAGGYCVCALKIQGAVWVSESRDESDTQKKKVSRKTTLSDKKVKVDTGSEERSDFVVFASRRDKRLTHVAGDLSPVRGSSVHVTVDCGIVKVQTFFRSRVVHVWIGGGEPLCSSGLDRHGLVTNATWQTPKELTVGCEGWPNDVAKGSHGRSSEDGRDALGALPHAREHVGLGRLGWHHGDGGMSHA